MSNSNQQIGDLSRGEVFVDARRPSDFSGKYVRGKWTYRLPIETIPESEIKETFTTDVLVVGAGTSGKAAALTAVNAGAKVIQIDRHTTFRYSGGHIGAIDSRLQKKLGVKIDKDEVILALQKASGNMADQRFYRMWADQSGEIMNWIMDLTEPEGIETLMYLWPRPEGFDNSTEYYPDFPVSHWQVQGNDRTLDHGRVLKVFEKHARQAGVDIHYQTRALQLERNANGRVTGLIALDKGGRFVRYNARRAVVMCTGDYGNNTWMMQKYCPEAAEIALENNIYMTRNEDLRVAPEPLDTGDGHQMLMRIGGVIEPGPHAPMSHATTIPMGCGAFLHVNLDGERYENEDVSANAISNSLGRQRGKKCWQIIDSQWKEQLPRMGVGLGKAFMVNQMILDRMEKETVSANTIEDLAKKIDVPVKTLMATVERYNQLAETGKDLDYAKRPDRLFPLVKPPFYAGISRREFLVVLGGMNTNIKLQPLDADRNVIPGIYLAGNMVGNRFAQDYPVMCPGLSHSLAYVTGRLAGRLAAAEK